MKGLLVPCLMCPEVTKALKQLLTCVWGVGKVFLCHWTLDQRGVKDCLCPFSIAAARGWQQRKHQLPLLSLELGFLSPLLLPRQTCPSLLRLWLHSECNKPAWHCNVAKPEIYPIFLVDLLLFISAEILSSSVCAHRSGVSWKSSSSSSNHIPNLV